jgi:hypothetical protein
MYIYIYIYKRSTKRTFPLAARSEALGELKLFRVFCSSKMVLSLSVLVNRSLILHVVEMDLSFTLLGLRKRLDWCVEHVWWPRKLWEPPEDNK